MNGMYVKYVFDICKYRIVTTDEIYNITYEMLATFRTFQHQFSPDGNRNQCTHAVALSPPS